VVLPIIGVLLGGGILLLFLAAIDFLPDQFVFMYNFLIKTLNSFINWVANQDSFLFSDIHFSGGNLISIYLLLAAVFLLWKEFSYKNLLFVLMSFSLVIGIFIWDTNESSQNELIIFHKSRKTLIGFKHADQFVLFRSDSLKNFHKTFPIQGYRVAKDIKFYCDENIPKLFRYGDKTILVLDSLGVYPKLSEKVIVILTESPRVNLERLIATINPEIIVADGSNYNSYVARWKKTCAQKKLPFHHTGSKGAILIE
jgi:competence protein ComEC